MCDESSPIHSYECLYAQVLQRVKPKIVCEWGPGLNTKMALDSGATVFTIEHNPRYVPKPHANLVILQIDVEDPLYIHPFNFENVDIFFIDARRRNECMECIASESKLDAVVVLHDSKRDRYAKGMSLFPYKIDDGSGTCILSRSKLW